MEFETCLQKLANEEGSDLYFSTNAPVSAKFHGVLTPLDDVVLQPGEVARLADGIMDEDQRQHFRKVPEMNMAIARPELGRFRVNIFKQRNEVSMVIRRLGSELPQVKDLGLPPVLPKLIMQKRGLILFVGGTGSGKSTSLAALIDHRNKNSKGHIITIEDPVEFTHPHKGCIVNQREVGTDTLSWEDALANTLRQAPDVILIGEIRHRETMEHALAFAETGHLCLSTLHANNANQALDRIINFFPEDRHQQLLLDLSLNIRGIVSQRLIPTIDGKRAAAIEVMLGTPRACDLIHKGDITSLKELMTKSEEQGMQTFDSALFKLYQQGKITLEEALKNADSRNNLRLRIKIAKENPSGEGAEAAPAAAPEPAAEKPAEPLPEPKAPEPAEQEPALAPTSSLDDLSLVPLDEEGAEEEAPGTIWGKK